MYYVQFEKNGLKCNFCYISSVSQCNISRQLAITRLLSITPPPKTHTQKKQQKNTHKKKQITTNNYLPTLTELTL